MNISALTRELWLVLRDRAFVTWLVVTFALASFAVWSGSSEVRIQADQIEELVRVDEEDRRLRLGEQSDWGGAAYYAFHFTYAPPSEFAFAAIGQRDTMPWKHRIRMLALEGQIYESDPSNPALALIGRFDFAFFAALLLPLILIASLADIRSREREAGRLELLEATAHSGSFWWIRAGIRLALLIVCASIPLWAGAFLHGTAIATVLLASAVVIGHVLFWGVLAMLVGRSQAPSTVLQIGLVGLWLLLAVVIPSSARVAIDQAVELPPLAEIVMTQREAVNDAWDLPKEATMEKFLAAHPDWAEFSDVSRPFEWKWYYAFQQVGDQSVEAESRALRDGRRRRDELAGLAAILSPPALVERALQTLAGTDAPSMLQYEEDVRAFHRQLREFHYPGLFRGLPFEESDRESVPRFVPKRSIAAHKAPVS